MESIHLPETIREKITEDAICAYPDECCGLLFGEKKTDGSTEIMRAVCMKNGCSEEEARSHYRIDPVELFRQERIYKEQGLELIGFYHSHPFNTALASEEDIEEMIPGQIYMIVSLKNRKDPEIRVWEKMNDLKSIYRINRPEKE